jgi:taurine dioxygenase
MLHVKPNANDFGAFVTGIDLSRTLPDHTIAALLAAWHRHRVLAFPDQPMTHAELERFTGYFGPFGDDPYIAPIESHPHVLEVRRDANEETSVFGAAWHSDWSFLATPPAATILHAKQVPPHGGDTLFADAEAAYATLPDVLKERIAGRRGIHSAAGPYSPEGFYANEAKPRSMKILPNASARAARMHPLVRVHPVTRRRSLFVNAVYTIGIEGMEPAEAKALLEQLCRHATQDALVYRHRWQANMLVIWDNRCVQHCATGGYAGFQRVMHRTTVAGETPLAA